MVKKAPENGDAEKPKAKKNLDVVQSKEGSNAIAASIPPSASAGKKLKKIKNTAPTEIAIDHDDTETEKAITRAPEDFKSILAGHSAFFNKMLAVIPSKFYFPLEAEQEIEQASKFLQNKQQKAPRQELKEATKKAKKAKLDPANQKTILEIQSEQQSAMNNNIDVEKGLEKAESKNTPILVPGTKDELRQRLANLILQQRGKRKELSSPKDRSVQPNKKKRARLANDLKEAKKATLAALAENGEAPSGGKDGVASNVVFSKFDFSTAERDSQKKKPLTSLQLLAKITSEREKLNELKKTDPAKAQEISDKQKWKKAMQRSEGEKVKDDPSLLMKTIKRTKKIKEKSAKIWTDRTKTVEDSIKEKQDKRKENLRQRASERKQRKMGRGVKAKTPTKKKRPGFEGGGGAKKSSKEKHAARK